MATLKQFKLPDLGEGLTEGEILQWLVEPGETVRLNQPIVEVETAKAAVEVPSPYAGRITELHHSAGETVDVGAPIVTFDIDPEADGGGQEAAARSEAAGAAANPEESVSKAVSAEVDSAPAAGDGGDLVPPDASVASVDEEPEAGSGLIGSVGKDGRTAVLVGYGPRSVTAKRRPRKSGSSPAAAGQTSTGEAAPAAAGSRSASSDDESPRADAGAAEVVPLTKPPLRKLARDLGVDLTTVRGSGPGGVITREDVQGAAQPGGGGATPAGGIRPAKDERADDLDGREVGDQGTEPAGALPAPTYGVDQRLPIKGVRKRTAEAMVASAFTAPHVTEFLTVDVTPMMKLRRRLAARPDLADVRLSPLVFVAKALLLAVRRNPMINASWDDEAQEIVVRSAVNLGIAAATPRGLLVPNIKSADQLSLVDLARALAELTATAREGRTAPGDMQGGTITITNVGVFGVDNGTPILNPGEAAILCFGAVREQPWVHRGKVKIRQLTQLSLSFDHRLVDGQLGSQFLADVGALLADPQLAVLWG